MAPLISLHEQKRIIHCRHAYRSKEVKVGAEKCYEWSHHRCTWETRLTWQARLPDSAYAKNSEGKPDKSRPLPGLGVFQEITFIDTLISVEKECPKVTLKVTEVFPLSGVQSELFEDPQEHGWLWAHDCAEKSTAAKSAAPQQCKLVSDVSFELQFVTATVKKANGDVVPFEKEHVTNNLNASIVSSAYQFEGDAEPTATRSPAGTLVPTPTPLPDQGEHGKHSLHACVDHCKNWMELSKVRAGPDEDIPAVETPSDPKPGPTKKEDQGRMLPAGDPRRLPTLVVVGASLPASIVSRGVGGYHPLGTGPGRYWLF